MVQQDLKTLKLSMKKKHFNKFMNTCNRVLIVSNGVVMHDAVAPAIIPPAAWTNIIFDRLGVPFSDLTSSPKNLPKQPVIFVLNIR